MEIVIKIPNETYKSFIDDWTGTTEILQAVRHGKPLPKYHGRIIDESKITAVYYHEEGYYRMVIDGTDAPTIIEGSDSE